MTEAVRFPDHEVDVLDLRLVLASDTHVAECVVPAGDRPFVVDGAVPFAEKGALRRLRLGAQLQSRHAVGVHLERNGVLRDEFLRRHAEVPLEPEDVVWREGDIDSSCSRR